MPTVQPHAIPMRARWEATRNIAHVGLIADNPWRVREFAIIDPSGNLLRVWHPLGPVSPNAE